MVPWPIALAVLFAAGGTGCSSSEPEAELEAVLAAAESAAENRDVAFFRDLLAPGYRDAQGNDRDAMLTLIRGYLLARPDMEIISSIDDIALEQDAAFLERNGGR